MNELTITGEAGKPAPSNTWQEKVQFKKTALVFLDDLSFEEYEALSATLDLMESGVQWWQGDRLNYGERRYGEVAAAAIAEDKSPQTFMNYVWVANAIQPSRRRETLSFTHHAEVAALPIIEQEEILNWAEETIEATGRPRPKEAVRAKVKKRREQNDRGEEQKMSTEYCLTERVSLCVLDDGRIEIVYRYHVIALLEKDDLSILDEILAEARQKSTKNKTTPAHNSAKNNLEAL